MKVDFGLTAGDYARHRAGFPDSFFERIAAFGIGTQDQALVDIGTGTGSLARGFAKRGCKVVGIDPSENLLEAARGLDAEAGVAIDYRIGRAEHLELPDAAFEVVTAGQCWHWFDAPLAAAEIARVLCAEGRLVIAHFDWLPLAGNVVDATERLIEHHNPAWKLGGGMGLYPRWLRDLGEAGYSDLQTFSYDEDALYSPEAWRGRIRASAGVGGSLTSDAVEDFDRALQILLEQEFSAESLAVPHRIFALVARPPER